MEKNFHEWKKNFHEWKKISTHGNFFPLVEILDGQLHCIKAKSRLFIQEIVVDGQFWRHISTQPVSRLKPVKNGTFWPFLAKFGLFVSEKGHRCPATEIFIKAKSRGF